MKHIKTIDNPLVWSEIRKMIKILSCRLFKMTMAEQLFSQRGNVKTLIRNKLSIEILDYILRIKLNLKNINDNTYRRFLKNFLI